MSITGLSNSFAQSAISSHNAKVQQAGEELTKLSSGRNLDNPAVNSIVNKLNSDLGVFRQNQISAQNGQALLQVATGALNSQVSLLSTMRTLSAQASNGDITNDTRAVLNNQYQELLQQVDTNATRARWNGASLLSGGAIATPTMAGAITASGSVVADGNNILAAGIVAANSTGFISGQASNISVTSNVANAGKFDIALDIKDPAGGTQTFKALNVTPTNAGTVTLYSESDNKNAITLTFGSAATGVSKAALTTALETSLGLAAGQAPASFKSSSVALPATVDSITAGSVTPAGTYALSYAADSKTLLLSQGASEFKVNLSADGAQTATFANGISVDLDSTFALNAGVAQTVFTVSGAESQKVTFQLDVLASDTQTVEIASSSTKSLKLDGSNITNVDNARAATSALLDALQNVNTSLTKLGAAQQRLVATVDNLETTIQNTQGAASTYGDADLTETLSNYVQSKVMADVSYTGISQSLTMAKDLAAFIKNNG